MKKYLLVSLILIYTFANCLATAEEWLFSIDLTYESRGIQIPATVVIPQGEGPFPLAVMIHGFGGQRKDEGSTTIASALSAQGIATIRMDFPGHGESEEDSSFNSESNMKKDILNGIKYARDKYPIDASRIGAFGYSLGGRLILELIDDEAYTFKSIALLAPAADTDDFELIFGGQDRWDKLKKEARSSESGFAMYDGGIQHLSKQWFADIEKYNGNSLITKAARKFAGPVLVIYAVDDAVVHPSVSKAVAEALNSQVVVVPAGGHSYGYFGNNHIILQLTSTAVAAFFAYNLKMDTVVDTSGKPLTKNGMYVKVRTLDKGPLNFRTGASSDARLIGTIPNGSKVQIISYGNMWTQIQYRGRKGYVKSTYLDISQ